MTSPPLRGEPLRPAALAPGSRLDRYELLYPLAQGGMGSVWGARMRGKHGFEKLVALKTILPQHAADPRVRQMFLDEARIASRIDHENVARILDLGEERDVLYLVMEWVDGDSLANLEHAARRAKTPLPVGLAVHLVAGVCAGLHAAHELTDARGARLGVVHRDVSPQNVLVSARGEVKLIDFGIAKARGRAAAETSIGGVKGKVHFMAPEQALGQAVDLRADVWAAGAVLYALLAGHAPFDADNDIAVLHRLVAGGPPPPLPPRVPAGIAAVVSRALAYEAEDRYSSAQALGAALLEAAAEARIFGSAGEVVAFAAPLLQARTDARRRALDFALEAAAERDRMEKLLEASAAGEVLRLDEVRAAAPTLPEGARGLAPLAADEERTDAALPAATLGGHELRGRRLRPATALAAGLAVAALALYAGGLRSSAPSSASSGAGAVRAAAAAPGELRPSGARPPPGEGASPVRSPSTAGGAVSPIAASPAAAGPSAPPGSASPRSGAHALQVSSLPKAAPARRAPAAVPPLRRGALRPPSSARPGAEAPPPVDDGF